MLIGVLENMRAWKTGQENGGRSSKDFSQAHISRNWEGTQAIPMHAVTFAFLRQRVGITSWLPSSNLTDLKYLKDITQGLSSICCIISSWTKAHQKKRTSDFNGHRKDKASASPAPLAHCSNGELHVWLTVCSQIPRNECIRTHLLTTGHRLMFLCFNIPHYQTLVFPPVYTVSGFKQSLQKNVALILILKPFAVGKTRKMKLAVGLEKGSSIGLPLKLATGRSSTELLLQFLFLHLKAGVVSSRAYQKPSKRPVQICQSCWVLREAANKHRGNIQNIPYVSMLWQLPTLEKSL